MYFDNECGIFVEAPARLLREAEHERLVQEALKSRKPSNGIFHAVRMQMGRSLVTLGRSFIARSELKIKPVTDTGS